jgi:glucose-6-phosphate isomerase
VNNLISAKTPADCPAAVGAALLMGLEETKGIHSHVCMAYGDRFERFTAWARQLWAESLGKDGKGSLFVPAIGPVDQHSQVQLYRDGPATKSYTILMTATKGTGKVIQSTHDEDTFGYIKGRTLGDIVDAEQRATADALVSRGLPVRTITCAVWDAYTMGALMMHWMLETIFAAELMGINAYDQPAVEEGKIRAKAYLQEMN